MALSILAEALARIEHKLDLILRAWPAANVVPMSFLATCPVCKKLVEYQIDLNSNVVRRCCGCSSNILPSVVPMYPTQQRGAQDGPGNPDSAAPVTENSD